MVSSLQKSYSYHNDALVAVVVVVVDNGEVVGALAGDYDAPLGLLLMSLLLSWYCPPQFPLQP